jgi:hypothetical protein
MADSALPGAVIQAITLGNTLSVGMQPAILSNLALGNLIQNVNQSQQNAVSMQQLLNQLQMTIMGKMVDQVTRLSPAVLARRKQQAREQEVLKLLIAVLNRQKR